VKRRRGITLVEVLAALLLLAVLGSLALGVFLDRLSLVSALRVESESRALLDQLEQHVTRAFSAAPAGATQVRWHFAGVTDTLSLTGAGTQVHPQLLAFLAPETPRWEVYPLGRPEVFDPQPGTTHEAAVPAWRIFPPASADAPEGPPTAPGWDVNQNGVRDAPDDLADLPAEVRQEHRPWSYRLEVTPAAAPGEPVRVRVVLLRGLAQAYQPGEVFPRMKGRSEVGERTLELVPGETP